MIYKSGAGSGKTYTLTREFLKLALRSENAWSYKQILAVTFTKKAANEMKSRILEWLKEFATSDDLSKNSKAQEITEALQCSNETLQSRARNMHEHILHHYSDFSIQTIDSFVHRIIKSFSRDLKLSTDFEVEMDVEKVITEVVSDQLQEMGENQELSHILQNFLEHQLDEEKSTQLKSELVSFFKSNSDEDSQKSLDKISAKSFQDFKIVRQDILKKSKQLQIKIDAIRLQMKRDIGELDGIDRNLGNWIKNSDFSKFVDYAKTPVNLLAKSTIFKKGFLDRGGEYQVVNTLILTHLDELIPLLDEYLIVSKLIKNCYLIALIQDYKQRFEAYKQENNTILISDFTQIIHDVVKDNPAPFIYERLGERYKYYLIDEFQDTSITQWQNFLPLITHTLANGNMAMIVGDSKQAIYRWRNGDFKLFANLPKMEYDSGDFILKEAERQLSQASSTVHLSHNFRSSSEIVEFNNKLFGGLKTELSETGLTMYKEFEQKPTLNLGDGYVEVQLFGKATDDKEEFLDKIKNIILGAASREFNYGDIAILTRKNNTLTEIATYLNDQNIKTSSQEGLLLHKNLKVQLIICTLHSAVFPTDDSNNTQLFTLMERWKGNPPDLLLHENELDTYSTKNGRVHYRIKIWNYLEKQLGKVNPEKWRRSSAYDALLEITEYLNLNQQTDDYVETLLDFSFQTARLGKNSVKEFLEHWYENEKLSLATTDSKDSVKLMTVHKSKGLEFPIVIYAEPFYRSRSNSIWYDLSDLKLPLESTYYSDGGLLKDHQGNLQRYETIKAHSLKEKSDQTIDDMNLFYVANTRASQNLFIVGFSADGGIIKPVKEAFRDAFNHELDTDVYTSGELVTKRQNSQLKEDQEVSNTIQTSLKSYDWKNRLAYRFANQTLDGKTTSVSERSVGIAIHSLLAELVTVDNWELIWLQLEAIVFDQQLIEGLKNLSKTAEWKQWFSEPIQVLNEKHLIDSEGNEFIPDRVMEFANEIIVVDYKTGGATDRHSEQVQNYMRLLSKIYSKPVSGRLVYIKEAEIQKINLDYQSKMSFPNG